MKNIALALLLVCGLSGLTYAGECVNGNCVLRSRSVEVVQEIISVPVTVTHKTVKATRNVGRRAVSKVRNTVR